ncbi:MAG: UDP-N-acetylglucosamine 1-carboxyvinyltransferase, partial [Clostridium sp.]
MEKLLIEGGRKLVGKVKVSGAKNAAVAILPAAILADSGTCTIDNLPNIEDINCLEQIIGNLGATVERAPGTMKIDPSGIKSHLALRDEVKRMRASYYLIGALLSKFGKAEVVFPGGCNIGTRPIDQHIKGFEAMGATVTVEDGVIKAYTENGLRGANIYLDVVSVGATINIMLAATKAEGTT